MCVFAHIHLIDEARFYSNKNIAKFLFLTINYIINNLRNYGTSEGKIIPFENSIYMNI